MTGNDIMNSTDKYFIDDNEEPEDILLDLPESEIDRLYDETFDKK